MDSSVLPNYSSSVLLYLSHRSQDGLKLRQVVAQCPAEKEHFRRKFSGVGTVRSSYYFSDSTTPSRGRNDNSGSKNKIVDITVALKVESVKLKEREQQVGESGSGNLLNQVCH